jgi:ribosomal protein S18 acetylase RimI-like enzyme
MSAIGPQITGPFELSIGQLRLAEIPSAVRIHQAAFDSFFLTFLGADFLELLYHFYTTGRTEVALAGELGGRIIGTVIGTTQPLGFYARLAKYHFVPFAYACVRPLIQRPRIFPRLVRALLYRGDAPRFSASGALLASICVDPAFQGRGLGRKLLAAFESEMWKRRAEFVYLITDRENNHATVSFYERLGWTVESEFLNPERRALRRYWKMAPPVKPLFDSGQI